MLFNEQGHREFLATQSNGEKRQVTYHIDPITGASIIIAVDGLPVSEYPLSGQFTFVVLGWIEEHRANLSSHADFFDIPEHERTEMHEITNPKPLAA